MTKALIQFSLLLITSLTVAACSSGGGPESKEKAVAAQKLRSDFVKQAAEKSWCLVSESGETPDGMNVNSLRFLADGTGAVGTLTITNEGSGAEAGRHSEVKQKGIQWIFDNGILSIKDLETSEVQSALASFTAHDPTANLTGQPSWSAGVQPGSQSCLKLEDPKGGEIKKDAIYCGCDLEKISAALDQQLVQQLAE